VPAPRETEREGADGRGGDLLAAQFPQGSASRAKRALDPCLHTEREKNPERALHMSLEVPLGSADANRGRFREKGQMLVHSLGALRTRVHSAGKHRPFRAYTHAVISPVPDL
jgi:hypothetical protein